MSRAGDIQTALLKLRHSERKTPVPILALAALTQTTVTCIPDPKLDGDQVSLQLPTRDTISRKVDICRYLARSAKDTTLAGIDVIFSIDVDYWLEFADLLVNGVGLEPACTKINDYLSLRTYLAGYQMTAADAVCWAHLAGALQWEGLKKTGRFPHLERWYTHLSSIPVLRELAERYSPKTNNARKKQITQTIKEQKADPKTAHKRHTDATYDIGVGPEWEGKVVTRFPPEPSGFLHIGHAKALILNQQIATAHKGRMLIRFDDTNPDKEKDVYMESILADCQTLGADTQKVTYTSDYFPQMLKLAELLIKAGHLYADDSTQEIMKEDRLAKRPSARRDRSTEDTLRIWNEMKNGTPEGFRNCLRFRIDPANNNGTLRDPVAYRCNATPHLRTGTQYKVYPTYDCACPFVDSLEGVTHALRSSEYKDREEQFYRILRLHQQVWPGLADVRIEDYSRLSFVNTVLSKRKLTKLVDCGAVDGWDDPRMPTVQGLLRRGLTVSAMREFMISQGASKAVTNQEWGQLWTFNKTVIDPVCPRHTAVKADGKVLLRLKDMTGTEYVTLPKHKKNSAAGKKTTMRSPEIWLDQADASLLKEGEEVTLMDWGNAIIEGVERDASGTVSGLTGRTHLEGDFKKTDRKLTWLAESDELVPLSLQDFDHLLTKPRLEDDDDILQLLTVCSKWDTQALGDANMRGLQKGDIIQLERKGYFIVDEPYKRPGKPMMLLSIPDGRSNAPVKPAEAVRAAELVAAQRAAKIQAEVREQEAAALKAAVPVKENSKAASKKKKKVLEELRQEDVSMNDAPVSTKVTVMIDPAKSSSQPSSSGTSTQTQPGLQSLGPKSNGISQSQAESQHLRGSDFLQSASIASSSTESSRHLESNSQPLSKASSSEAPRIHETRSSSGVSIESSGSPRGSKILQLQRVAEMIVPDAGSPQTSSKTSPIPVPSPRVVDADARISRDVSVPATPANTPQAAFEIPQRHKGVDFSSSKLFPTIKAAARGSVPPTPANTPQRSCELPSGAERQQLGKSNLGRAEWGTE